MLVVLGLGIVASPAIAAGIDPRLDLSSPGGGPFPSDRWTVPDRTQLTGVRVALPKPDCVVRPSDYQDINVLNRLDGFNLQPPLSIPFTGVIDALSVSSSSSDVFLVRLHGGDRTGSRVVGINQIVWDPASDTLHAEADQFLDQDTTYALVVTTGVRDASGDAIGRDDFRKVLNFGQTKDPSDKAYRKQLLDALATVKAATGTDPSRVASESVFTTQSATAVMEKIRSQLDATPPSPARFDLRPGGARTVFLFPAITSIVFNRQLKTTGPLSPTPVPSFALNLFPGSVGQVAFGSCRSPDYETGAGEIPKSGPEAGCARLKNEPRTTSYSRRFPIGPIARSARSTTEHATSGYEHASRTTLPLLVHAEAPRSRPNAISAFVGIGTVREAVAVDHADCCILIEASAPIGPDDVAVWTNRCHVQSAGRPGRWPALRVERHVLKARAGDSRAAGSFKQRAGRDPNGMRWVGRGCLRGGQRR